MTSVSPDNNIFWHQSYLKICNAHLWPSPEDSIFFVTLVLREDDILWPMSRMKITCIYTVWRRSFLKMSSWPRIPPEDDILWPLSHLKIFSDRLSLSSPSHLKMISCDLHRDWRWCILTSVLPEYDIFHSLFFPPTSPIAGPHLCTTSWTSSVNTYSIPFAWSLIYHTVPHCPVPVLGTVEYGVNVTPPSKTILYQV